MSVKYNNFIRLVIYLFRLNYIGFTYVGYLICILTCFNEIKAINLLLIAQNIKYRIKL